VSIHYYNHYFIFISFVMGKTGRHQIFIIILLFDHFLIKLCKLLFIVGINIITEYYNMKSSDLSGGHIGVTRGWLGWGN